MHFSFHLDANLKPDEARRVAAAVLALGGVNETKVGELVVGVTVDTSQAVEAIRELREQTDGVLTPAQAAAITTTVEVPPAPPKPAEPGDTLANPWPANPPSLDANGLPWDERIHSSSRATNADGTWRAKRGVSGVLVAEVEAELRALVPSDGRRVVPANEVTDEMMQAKLDREKATPPPPPVVAAAPVPPAAPGNVDFAQVVKFIMDNAIPEATYVATLGSSLPDFCKACMTEPGLAAEKLEQLRHLV